MEKNIPTEIIKFKNRESPKREDLNNCDFHDCLELYRTYTRRRQSNILILVSEK